MNPEPTDPSATDPRRRAIDFWDGVIDSQNLQQCDPAALDAWSIDREIAWADAPDLRNASDWMAGSVQRKLTVDLGCGMGAHSFALARKGWDVIAVDGSLARLRALNERAGVAGITGQITPVLADAHALPFRDGSVPALMTKSVLIHTDMPVTAGEIARVLKPGGRAALIEPQTGNPFVALYRKLLAPKEWAGITNYFNPERRKIYQAAFRGGRHGVRFFYFMAFFAHVFQFALPEPRCFRWAMAPLNAFDRWLFGVLRLSHRWAWFGMICLEKKRDEKD